MTTLNKLNRRQLIELIVDDLKAARSQDNQKFNYAIDQNIIFFNAARSLPRYIYWLLTRYAKINGRRILELSDFKLRNGAWEKILLLQLLNLEKNKFPDILSPLRKQLYQDILKISQHKKEPIIIINIGCGGMEIERRLAQEFTCQPLLQPVAFIGIDLSPAALNVARQNLDEYSEAFTHLDQLSPAVIDNIKHSKLTKPVQFYFFVGDALKLDHYIPPQSIDIVFHSKFHHHLSDSDKNRFDNMIQTIAHCAIEYDDYRGAYLPVLSIFTSWRKPVLLNGAVLSSLRDPTREQIKEFSEEGWITKIYPLKGFLKIYRSSQNW